MSNGRWLSRIYREFGVVQFPIVDLRVLAEGPTGRLRRPSWPDPIAGVEFVRGVGMVRDRPGGAIRDWSGERAFCDAAGLLRLPEPHFRQAVRPGFRPLGPEDAIMMIPCYRRLYSDGLSTRVDVAFISRWPDQTWRCAWRRDLDYLSVPVGLPWRDDGPLPLGAVSRQLARRYAEITTRHGSEVRYDLVEAGTPMVLTEWHTDKGLPPGATQRDGVHFRCRPVRFGDQRMPSWGVTFSPHCDGNRARQVRGNLWRLHTERESLRGAIRVWRRGDVALDRQRLRDYLAERLKILNRERRAGVEQVPLLDIAQRIESLAPPDVIDDLRRELRRESLGVLRSLDRVIEKTIGYDYAVPVDPSLHIHVEHGGHITMSAGDTYNVHGGAYGSTFGPHAQTHNRDFAITPISSEELRSLAGHVSELTGLLSGEQRQELIQAHEDLEQAASTDDRSPGRVRAAAERLMRIAAAVGTAGAPLLEAVTKLLKASGLT
ncbi:hypothetical protein KGA66_27835 [Actinocrinis puniceicyclus]|uniref:Uncharacterized protein n=1 Tax=Actinocrinis puniceicyclus TaxID=977794 RepID=A0A8J8BG83_9ACTN|nr:hypothetical protein [Actinocrinis puniceicyclus]MBS2966876.1 hypothetical protein [Actinocrinis puniceicyclus]